MLLKFLEIIVNIRNIAYCQLVPTCVPYFCMHAKYTLFLCSFTCLKKCCILIIPIYIYVCVCVCVVCVYHCPLVLIISQIRKYLKIEEYILSRIWVALSRVLQFLQFFMRNITWRKTKNGFLNYCLISTSCRNHQIDEYISYSHSFNLH